MLLAHPQGTGRKLEILQAWQGGFKVRNSDGA